MSKHNTNMKELAERVASGEIDESAVMDSIKGIQFMDFIISYGELHNFELGTMVTGATNVPVNIGLRLLDSGNFDMAFAVIDGAIEALQSGKDEMMKKFNEQTPDGGVPPTE